MAATDIDIYGEEFISSAVKERGLIYLLLISPGVILVMSNGLLLTSKIMKLAHNSNRICLTEITAHSETKLTKTEATPIDRRSTDIYVLISVNMDSEDFTNDDNDDEKRKQKDRLTVDYYRLNQRKHHWVPLPVESLQNFGVYPTHRLDDTFWMKLFKTFSNSNLPFILDLSPATLLP